MVTSKPKSSATRGRGRPPVHSERWAKATVVLLDRQIAFLDRLAADIRLRTSSAISRAEIIRGLIDGLAASRLDVTSLQSEQEIADAIAARLKG